MILRFDNSSETGVEGVEKKGITFSFFNIQGFSKSLSLMHGADCIYAFRFGPFFFGIVKIKTHFFLLPLSSFYSNLFCICTVISSLVNTKLLFSPFSQSTLFLVLRVDDGPLYKSYHPRFV